MDLLITNATVITCDDERRVLEDAAVAIKGDQIMDVGDSATLAKTHSQMPRLDGRDKAVIPGFINSHTHTVLTVLRGTVEDMSGDAVYGYMSPITFVMTPEERAAMATLGCLEAIRSGTTTVVESSRFVSGFAPAMVKTGLRLVLSELCADALTLRVRHGEYTYDRRWGEQFLARAHDLIEKFHGTQNGRVECQVAAHATENCSPWMLDQLLALAKKHGLRRNVHLAQSRGELDQIRVLGSGTPAEYLRDHGWLGEDLIGAHWTFCTEKDIDLLAEHGVHMAHCPANSSRRGPHKVRVDRIQDRGINIALGTDNMTEDMFQALKLGTVVHRGSYGGGVKPSPQTMLDTATRNGAIALGRLQDLGSIERGKKADITILDLDHARMRPVINPVSNIVHYGDVGIVSSVIADGEFLMHDGEVLVLDEKQVLREAQLAARSAWQRLLAQSPDIKPPFGLPARPAS